MKIFNKQITITTIKPPVQQARFKRRSGCKVGMDCAKKATGHHLFGLLGGAK
jgi:hypothetical protein